MRLVTNLPIQNDENNKCKITETLAHRSSSESALESFLMNINMTGFR